MNFLWILVQSKNLKMNGWAMVWGLGDTNGLSWTCNSCKLVGEQVLVINKADKKILRELAISVAEIAARPEQDRKRKLWEKHNDLVRDTSTGIL